MCEPAHSIVQYPDGDDDDRSTGTPLEQRIAGWGDWLRRIGRWLHLSKMGKGHTEAIQTTSLSAELFIPNPTYYEVNWWERTLHLDGAFRGGFNQIGRNALEHHALMHSTEAERTKWHKTQEEAKQAAQQYANVVSVGNMTTFRRFFTTSIAKSAMPRKYVLHFELMLNKAGRDLLAKKLKMFGRVGKTNIERVTKTLLWFTRKRELLIPEWADDKRLWVPVKPCWE